MVTPDCLCMLQTKCSFYKVNLQIFNRGPLTIVLHSILPLEWENTISTIPLHARLDIKPPRLPPTQPPLSIHALNPLLQNTPLLYYISSSTLNQSTPLSECLPWPLLRTLPLLRVSLPSSPHSLSLWTRQDVNNTYSFPRWWLRYHVNAPYQAGPTWLDESYDLTRIIRRIRRSRTMARIFLFDDETLYIHDSRADSAPFYVSMLPLITHDTLTPLPGQLDNHNHGYNIG